MVKTYIISEIGINHQGDMDDAHDLILSSARQGADAVKLQTYITEQRVPQDDPLYPLLKKCELSYDQQQTLYTYAKQLGLDFISTPFDVVSLRFLYELPADAIKISSFDLTNHNLLRACVMYREQYNTRKHVYLSTGLASSAEIQKAVDILHSDFTLFHCISAYPTPVEELNLLKIQTLRRQFGCMVGYSDHSGFSFVGSYAVAAGAEVIELHHTLKENTPDYTVSLKKDELGEAVRLIRLAETMKGTGKIKRIPIESTVLRYRRHTL